MQIHSYILDVVKLNDGNREKRKKNMFKNLLNKQMVWHIYDVIDELCSFRPKKIVEFATTATLSNVFIIHLFPDQIIKIVLV